MLSIKMVKFFAVRHMQIKEIKYIKIIQAKSLITLMIYFVIVIIISTFSFSNYFTNNTKNHKNFLNLKKLQQALLLARSEAIKQRTKVQLCPSFNLHVCSQDWTNDLIIFIEDQHNHSESKILHHLQLKFTDHSLKFSGNQKTQIITFLPNGLTNNNGNFCIKNYHCLYINRAGKVYIK